MYLQNLLAVVFPVVTAENRLSLFFFWDIDFDEITAVECLRKLEFVLGIFSDGPGVFDPLRNGGRFEVLGFGV